jgi:hypothetical protein
VSETSIARARVNLPGPVKYKQVLDHVESESLRWSIEAAEHDSGSFMTMVDMLSGTARHGAGFGGPRLAKNLPINIWFGQADGFPQFIMARTSPDVASLRVHFYGGKSTKMVMSAIDADFNLRFAGLAIEDAREIECIQVVYSSGESLNVDRFCAVLPG